MSCPSGKQYYVCAAGDFRGCCTLDPCTTGVCPDDDDDGEDDADDSAVTSSSAGPSTTAYGNPGSTSSSTSSTGPTVSTTPAQPDSATSAAPDTIAGTTASTPSATSGSSSGSGSGSGSSSNGALIGGVVGGVLGALAILAIVLFLFCRRRKKQGKRFTLLRGSPRDDEKGEESLAKPGLAAAAPRIKEPDHTRQHSSTTATTATTFTSPGTQTLSTLGTSPDASAVDNTTANTGDAPSFLPPIPPSASLLPPPPAPGRTGLTPELPDTGFYRQRAELATDSQSELINLPPGQRRHRPSPAPGPPKGLSAESKGAAAAVTPGSSPSPNTQQKEKVKRHTPPVVTTDGVVLRPNLDQGSRRRTGDGHVMSFMQYESGSESGKGEKEKEMKEGGNAPDVGLGLKGVDVAGSDSCQKL